MKTLPTFHPVISGPANAPCLTFIPGIGNDAEFWAEQATALSAHFRVLRFDPWGHGQSPAPPQDCNFAAIRDGVVQLWDRLGISHCAVIGLGFGGSLALALGLEYPERVTRIAAFCCRPRQPEDRREFWRGRCDAAQTQGMDTLADVTVDRWLSAAFRASQPHVDSLLRTMMKNTTLEGYLAYVHAFIEMDFSARFPDLRVPTLLVAAEHDHGGGPVADMQAMAAQNPNTSLQVIANVGHICNHEAPAKVEQLLRQFFHH
jgi:3-oxoadipate enol-lactonase